MVTQAFREGQQVQVGSLAGLAEMEVGMLSTVVIGNSQTMEFKGLVVTPRGYKAKYDLDQKAKEA